MTEDTDTLIVRARRQLDEAEHHLAYALQFNCPTQHETVQHRDGLPPWCASCGYTDRGEKVR